MGDKKIAGEHFTIIFFFLWLGSLTLSVFRKMQSIQRILLNWFVIATYNGFIMHLGDRVDYTPLCIMYTIHRALWIIKSLISSCTLIINVHIFLQINTFVAFNGLPVTKFFNYFLDFTPCIYTKQLLGCLEANKTLLYPSLYCQCVPYFLRLLWIFLFSKPSTKHFKEPASQRKYSYVWPTLRRDWVRGVFPHVPVMQWSQCDISHHLSSKLPSTPKT